MQLPKDLAPLLSPDSTLTANEAGNSLIMTDTQTNIRRIAEIIKVLDSVSSSINSLRVLPLKYADAKALAGVIKELFPAADSSRPNNGGGNFNAMAAMLTGDGGNDPAAGVEANGHTPVPQVLAVADDHSNSLIVSAPEELVLTIEQLVQSVDTSSQGITELRAFRLKNADAGEMAELLTSLFPDENNSNDANRSVAPFAFSGFRGLSASLVGAGKSSDSSDRMKRLGRVLAVADHRTASVIVSSARDLMPQIAAMVEQLDANPARKQKVFVYSLHNADAQNLQQILQELFPPNNNARTAAASQNNDPLTARSQAMQAQPQAGFNLGTGSGGNNNQISGRGF